MDKTIEILLGSYKNIDSVNVDNQDKIELFNRTSELTDYDVNDALSATDVFDVEREANPIYRIYGKIEYMSLLNGLKNNYTNISDFFTYETNGSYNITNSFNFYLVKASTGFTKISGQTTIDAVPDEIILNENFNTWISSSPSNYPTGWTVTVTPNSYVQKTVGNQAQFVLSTGATNIVTLSKEMLSDYGNMVIQTNISLLPNFIANTDSLNVSLWSDDTIIGSHNLLAGGIVHNQILINVTENLPMTKLTIEAGGNGKSIIMDYVKLIKTGTTTSSVIPNVEYIRYFDVVATPNDFEIFPVGFNKNVYNEQAYAFSFRKDFDVSTYFDDFKFPATELFLYAQYIPKTNGNGILETVSGTTWGISDGIASKFNLQFAVLNVGDMVKSNTNIKIGDLIQYDRENFLQTQISGQTIYVTTECHNVNDISINLVWKYNPFIGLRLRYFSDTLNAVNTGSTSYDDVSSIPEYATYLDDNGNCVWRDILPQGYTDPSTGVGVNYPFINMRRYLFTPIIFSISPDLTNDETLNAFTNIWFSRNITNLSTNLQSNDDLTNKLGKPCQ